MGDQRDIEVLGWEGQGKRILPSLEGVVTGTNSSSRTAGGNNTAKPSYVNAGARARLSLGARARRPRLLRERPRPAAGTETEQPKTLRLLRDTGQVEIKAILDVSLPALTDYALDRVGHLNVRDGISHDCEVVAPREQLGLSARRRPGRAPARRLARRLAIAAAAAHANTHKITSAERNVPRSSGRSPRRRLAYTGRRPRPCNSAPGLSLRPRFDPHPAAAVAAAAASAARRRRHHRCYRCCCCCCRCSSADTRLPREKTRQRPRSTQLVDRGQGRATRPPTVRTFVAPHYCRIAYREVASRFAQSSVWTQQKRFISHEWRPSCARLHTTGEKQLHKMVMMAESVLLSHSHNGLI
ncbi:hypothetical protein EVAR_45491_1 [Eumeta japonica]|uniref:Uncharacterized protein n=1 Tax=Eumeta variegata TaxID=151549 RepID=A0A4C1WHB4_EUMVA|nr:hypothetical protein EVAR_45491_1 [Eumeta japonica]